ncbi:MAG TPA: cbb3-type cytochrome c oxidase subunit I [Phycisphaeraceae bacterium]
MTTTAVDEPSLALEVQHGDDIAFISTAAMRWFVLAVIALGAAGVFALILVVARVPALGKVLVHDPELARRSLIVHVNLSMGAWFLACVAGMIRLLPRRSHTGAGAWPGLIIVSLGVITLAISTFFSSAKPVLSNYVPLLDHPVSLVGLILLVCGFGWEFLSTRRLSRTAAWSVIPADAQPMLKAAALVFFVAMMTFAASWWTQPEGLARDAYYERLAWGGGHVLQAFNTLGMLAAWLILLHRLTGRATLSGRFARMLAAMIVLPVLPGPWLVIGQYSDRWFTRMMEFGLFPATLLLLGAAAVSLWRRREHITRSRLASVESVGLLTSVVMTLAGFGLGALVTAGTTLLPAHYHANIGAVSVAYMGMLLALFPLHNDTARRPALARWQPLIYGTGQMVFVIGLAIAGGLGQAARKVYGQEQQLTIPPEWIGLMVAGVGGVLALGGGALFVAIMIRAFVSTRPSQSAPPAHGTFE